MIDRRSLLQRSAMGLMTLPLAPTLHGAAAPEEEGPHFFLELFFPGGLDGLYTFDARPLVMTREQTQVNYMQEEPTPLVGVNGQKTLVTSLVKPLLAHLDCFSILNGVMMLRGFDGHENNVNYAVTGNAFGGPSLLPQLNRLGGRTPLDFVGAGADLYATVSNAQSSVPLTPESAGLLAKRLQSGETLAAGSPLLHFIKARLTANGAGPGRFSQASAAMASSLTSVPTLAQALAKLTGGQAEQEPVIRLACLTGELFRNRICRSVQVGLDASVIPGLLLDTHDPKSAAASPKVIGACMQALADIFAYFRATPFDDRRSLLEVTTILIATEFGRTMRQSYQADVSSSGTDHNPLKNTILLGGKGVKPGRVVGATDVQTSHEVLSGAHLALDPERLKAMGRPMDFASLRALEGLRPAYQAADYLDFSCVANTVCRLFSAPPEAYRRLDKDGPEASPLASLLI